MLNKRFFKYHFPVILYCIVIFVQSSFPSIPVPKPEFISMDKLLHFGGYALLFLLFFYSLKNQNKSIKLQRYSSEYALLFTSLYGILDEIHQYFVPGRFAEVLDAAADISGALFVYAIVKIVMKRKMTGSPGGMAVLILLILISGSFFSGCGGGRSDIPGVREEMTDVNLDILVTDVEAWYDLMPVVDPGKENFRFLVQVKINKLENSFIDLEPENFKVSNFRIVFSNYVVKNKKPTVEIDKVSERSIEIRIYHDLKDKYIKKDRELPNRVHFEFELDYYTDLLKRFETDKVLIKKVY